MSSIHIAIIKAQTEGVSDKVRKIAREEVLKMYSLETSKPYVVGTFKQQVEITSNEIPLDELVTLAHQSGLNVTRSFINRFSCAVIRIKPRR